MEAETTLWAISATSLLLVVVSPLAEKRQARRKNLDRPSWVSWPLIQILGIMGTVIAAVLALKA